MRLWHVKGGFWDRYLGVTPEESRVGEQDEVSDDGGEAEFGEMLRTLLKILYGR